MLYLLGLPSEEGRNLPVSPGAGPAGQQTTFAHPRYASPAAPFCPCPGAFRAPFARSSPGRPVSGEARPGPARRGCSERGPPGGQQAARGEPGVGADGCGSLCRTTSLRRSSAGGPRPSRALDAPSTSSKRGRAGRGACGGLSARPRPLRGSGRRGLARGPKAAK